MGLKIGKNDLCGGVSKRYLQKFEIFIISDFTGVQNSHFTDFGNILHILLKLKIPLK